MFIKIIVYLLINGLPIIGYSITNTQHNIIQVDVDVLLLKFVKTAVHLHCARATGLQEHQWVYIKKNAIQIYCKCQYVLDAKS